MSSVEALRPLSLDLPQQRNFVRYYRSLPEKPAATIRLFNRSDYYTVHGEDATFAAKELFGSQTIKHMGDEPKLSYLVLSRNNFEKFIRELLLIKQYRVEVYVKSSESKNAEDWSLEYKGSPGNISQFEEVLFENSEVTYSTGIMAINLPRPTVVAASYINVTEAQMMVIEFTDNELFTELEGLIALICPTECIIPKGDSSELKTLNAMLERCGIMIAKAKKTEFNSDDIEQDLNRLLHFYKEHQRNAMILPETKLLDAMNCLQVLIKYLNLIGDDQYYNLFKLSTFDTRRFVHMDSAAVVALNVFPKRGTTYRSDTSKTHSLLGLLDKCRTQQGRRLLEQWLRQPLRDINLIRERIEVVEALVNDSESRHMLSSNNLTRVPDLLMLSKKLNKGKVTLQDCYRIYQTISNLPGVVAVLRKCNNKQIESQLIKPLCDLLEDCQKFQDMIEEVLDFDLVDRGEYLVKASYSDELQALSNERIVLEEKIQKLLSQANKDLGLESGKAIKLDYTDQIGYCFRVTLKDEKVLRGSDEYTIVATIKSGVRFTNDELTTLNNSYKKIKTNYEENQDNIVKEMIDVAVGYALTFRNLNLHIAKIDVLVSLANVACNAPIPYTKPTFLDEGSGILKLKKVRHPCVEVQDGVTFIPNDVEFKQGEKTFYIITGANMGGKSTYIRSIGVSVLLAHIGSFVPCAEAEISVVDSILSRIGANDSQIKGLSTFMIEMVEASSIIKCATSNSLVIIDELGRGTSTYDGCGIAWAIAEHLALNTKCFTLFATHFEELTELAVHHNTICNVHVSAVATETTLTPLYQVKEGPCYQSYGIHCAKMAGFPKSFLDLAFEYQKELENFKGMQHVSNYETPLQRNIIKEGEKIIKDFLKKVKDEINTKHMSNDDIRLKLNQLRSQLPKDNLYVNSLLEE